MSQPARPEAEHLFALIRARYGDRVTPKELEEIRKSLDAILDGAAAMRAIKLDNADEPHQTFKPSGEPE
ncbi:MAG: hypothetical protein NTV61_08495 [Candidatus Bathyarchaeota archaeon]|nr:hypothetical protein [Candidatus Bathyarchaeota archaeon]